LSFKVQRRLTDWAVVLRLGDEGDQRVLGDKNDFLVLLLVASLVLAELGAG
jgi:hypothetical protein